MAVTKARVFVDTETTGLKAPEAVTISVAALGQEPRTIRVRPPKPIELDATVVNGIRNKDVAGLPLVRDHEDYEELKELLEGSVVVAHNAPFDVEVLINAGIYVTDWIDTKELARKRWPSAPSYRLQHLYHWLELDGGGAPHTAEGDVLTLMALWNALEKPDAKEYVTEELSVPQRRSKSRAPALEKGFEKHPDLAPRETRRAILRKRSEDKKPRSKQAD